MKGHGEVSHFQALATGGLGNRRAGEHRGSRRGRGNGRAGRNVLDDCLWRTWHVDKIRRMHAGREVPGH